MRIAFVNWNNRRFGGTGTYLSALMPTFQRAGHETALWHEVDAPADYSLLPIPADAPVWSVSDLGLESALQGLREWRPDVLFAHGLLEPSVERRALDVAPAVFVAHAYYGTCVSGLKTFTKPVVTPCTRTFGWQCLAHYYPRRCGGRSPITMVQQYRLQRDRLDLLSRYAAIVTLSRHMQDEYINHGLRAELVGGNELAVPTIAAKALRDNRRAPGQPWRLLFVGRMDRLKGGSELLQALPDASRRLGRPLHVTFAGDGPRRQSWEAEARELNLRHPAIYVEFLGWLGPTELEGRYQHADLLALPSLWPEPLALVGSEAFKHGVPAVAFDVGGISDWLKPGINGVLAPGKPPTVHGLSDAIVTALADADTHARLSEGARSSVADFSGEEHARKVLRVLGRVSRAA